jgi:hypothetical protein
LIAIAAAAANVLSCWILPLIIRFGASNTAINMVKESKEKWANN